MTSHVSQAGIRSDGGHSGSTDWSNAARSRLYLNRPKAENGDEADTNARILTRKKANFASIGDTIKLHWENGLIVPDGLSTPSYFRRSADDVFLALVDAVTEEGQRVSPKPRAGNYAPALFMKRPPKEREDYQRVDFERAMQRGLAPVAGGSRSFPMDRRRATPKSSCALTRRRVRRKVCRDTSSVLVCSEPSLATH